MSTMLSRSRALRALVAAVLAIAMTATAASAASARARTGKYKGKTSQQLTVTLTVKNKGKRVDFAIPYAKETDCTGNSTFVAGNTDLGKNVTLKKNGAFRFTYSSQQPVTINGQPGATDRYTYTVTGKFKKDKVKGTFSERDDIYDASNNLYGSCKTTGVTYTGKRKKT
jgi:hypothetical protein